MLILSNDQLKQISGGCTINFNGRNIDVNKVDCALADLMTKAFIYKIHSIMFGFSGENPHLDKALKLYDSKDVYEAYDIVTDAIQAKS